jgi:pimeloyl-ACP methyl ester carboxylesterase
MSPSPSTTEAFDIRGLRHHVRHWGDVAAPMVFMLHGRMDSSPTFQFVVDALRQSWHVIAPDWRGYGDSERLSRPYWYYDYYADLDALLARCSPDRPVRLVGHSMGANIASIYAAARPGRVSQVVMLDFLGLPAPEADAPTELRKWLDAIADEPRLSRFADAATLSQRLLKVNPRLTPARAEFLARTTSRPLADGGIEMACDPWHKTPSPTLYRVDEVLATWRSIVAPVLLLIAEQGYVQQRFGNDRNELDRRLACFADRTVITIPDCGHNMQHDQPEAVAAALEDFLRRD